MELKRKSIILDSPFGKITIKRNQYGIPEIYASNEAALYFGQGFVQINDRQLQTYLLKIIFSGRAAELLNAELVA